MSSSTNETGYHIWEGSSQSCTFPTGVKFSWNINSNAQSLANYASVGYAIPISKPDNFDIPLTCSFLAL